MQQIPAVPSSYSPPQVLQYLKVVGFKPALSASGDADGSELVASFVPNIQNLRMLCHLHLLAFTFENSAMHYVYSGGARYEFFHYNLIDMTKCPHIILFVQLPEDLNTQPNAIIPTYLVDVGLGGAGLVRPILLDEQDGNEVVGTTPTERHRLRRIPTPKGEDDWNWWRLEVQRSNSPSTTSDSQWASVLIFSEHEFTLAEYAHASNVINTVPDSVRFWWMVIALRYFLVDPQTLSPIPESEQIPVGDMDPEKACYGRFLMIGEEVKRSIGKKSELVCVMKTEKERIQALRDIFKLKVEFEDERHVLGRPVAFETKYFSPAVAAYDDLMKKIAS